MDGGSHGNLGEAVAGGVFHNQEGRLICAYGHYMGNATNTIAEIAVVAFGLELCLEKGIERVIVDLDTRSVIAIILKGKGRWETQHFLVRIRNSMARIHVR